MFIYLDLITGYSFLSSYIENETFWNLETFEENISIKYFLKILLEVVKLVNFRGALGSNLHDSWTSHGSYNLLVTAMLMKNFPVPHNGLQSTKANLAQQL